MMLFPKYCSWATRGVPEEDRHLANYRLVCRELWSLFLHQREPCKQDITAGKHNHSQLPYVSFSLLDEMSVSICPSNRALNSARDAREARLFTDLCILATIMLWDFYSLQISLRDLCSQVEPMPTAVEAWSPNHWTAREFPILISI